MGKGQAKKTNLFFLKKIRIRNLFHRKSADASRWNISRKIYSRKQRITYRELLKHNSINCSSVLVRRDVISRFPMEHDDSHEDYITWLKILREYQCAVGINEPHFKSIGSVKAENPETNGNLLL